MHDQSSKRSPQIPIQVIQRDKVNGEVSKELDGKDQRASLISCVVAGARGELYDQHVDQKSSENTDMTAPKPNDAIKELPEDGLVTIYIREHLKQAGLTGIDEEIVGRREEELEMDDDDTRKNNAKCEWNY